jgi:hypothetical protein
VNDRYSISPTSRGASVLAMQEVEHDVLHRHPPDQFRGGCRDVHAVLQQAEVRAAVCVECAVDDHALTDLESGDLGVGAGDVPVVAAVQGQACGCPESRALMLTWCFAADGARHDPLMAVKLIYQMFAKLLSWMVLHARSETANEIEILVLRHQLAVCSDARHGHGSAGATAP